MKALKFKSDKYQENKYHGQRYKLTHAEMRYFYLNSNFSKNMFKGSLSYWDIRERGFWRRKRPIATQSQNTMKNSSFLMKPLTK